MAARTQAHRHLASTVASVERHNGPDDPRLPELRQQLALARVEQRIEDAVDDAPDLTAEQRIELARILLYPAAPAGEAIPA